MDDVERIVERLDGAHVEVLLAEVERAARAADDQPLAEAVTRLPYVLVRMGLRPGQRMLLGARPGVDAVVLLLAALRAGAEVEPLALEAGLGGMQEQVARLEPDWIAMDSLLYLAGARTPVRSYLRRRGLEVPRVGVQPGVHVRLGSWLPGVPRGALSLDRLRGAPHENVTLPEVAREAGRAFTSAVRARLADLDASRRVDVAGNDAVSVVAAMLAVRSDL